jgi:hypothetical protein
MAEVTRRVIIEVETRQKKSRLDAPDVGSAERAFNAEADAAKKATESTNQATEAVQRHAGIVRHSSTSMVRDFREAGEGAFRMARGLTLLAASGSDDMKRLVQSVALAQGAFDVFAGSFKVFTSLAVALGTVVSGGIVAVTVALAAGAIAWSRWADEAEKAKKRVLKDAEEGREDTAFESELQIDTQGRLIGAAGSRAERERRIRGELGRLDSERRAGQSPVAREFARTFGTFNSGVPDEIPLKGSPDAIAGQKRVIAANERQEQLTKELRDLQLDQLQEDRRRFDFLDRGIENFFGAPSGTIGKFRDAELEKESNKVKNEYQGFLDELIRITADSKRELRKLENPK